MPSPPQAIWLMHSRGGIGSSKLSLASVKYAAAIPRIAMKDAGVVPCECGISSMFHLLDHRKRLIYGQALSFPLHLDVFVEIRPENMRR